MVQQQLPQQAELAYRVVGNLRSPRALLPENTDPHMSLHYHVHVISAIANRQGKLTHAFHQPHDLGLLPRSDSAEHRRSRRTNHRLQLLFVLHEGEGRAVDDRASLPHVLVAQL